MANQPTLWDRFKLLGPISWALNIMHWVVWFFIHWSWAIAVLGGVGLTVGHYFSPRLTDSVLVGILGFCAIQVIGWQAGIRMGAYSEPRLSYRIISVREWMHPLTAMMRYADQDLWNSYVESTRNMQIADEKHRAAQLLGIGGERTRSLAAAMQEQREAMTSASYYDDACAVDLVDKLKKGSLVAKGMLIDPTEEIVIRPYEWRIMRLDPHNAITHGRGTEYRGIVIGKPR